ncbi:MAG: hypothetical protein IBX57_00590 [Gammaproteobacteria bacterium]|nr:hypothetical protein [Gammaproteobacteria bacterium]
MGLLNLFSKKEKREKGSGDISPSTVMQEGNVYSFPGQKCFLKYNPETIKTPWVKINKTSKVGKALKVSEVIDMSKYNDEPDEGMIFQTKEDYALWYWDIELAKPFPMMDKVNLTQTYPRNKILRLVSGVIK